MRIELIIEAVMAAVAGGAKVEWSLADLVQAGGRLHRTTHEMRANEWWGQELKNVVDKLRTALVIAGKAGCFTGLHVDWTQAKNIALFLGLPVSGSRGSGRWGGGGHGEGWRVAVE